MSTDPDTPDDVETLRTMVEQLQDRVADLEDRVQSSSTLPSAATDYRDARVLDALEPGDVITLREFRELFEANTDIRDSDTLRERIRDLAESEAFELAGRQRWRYLGPGGGE